MGTFSRRRPADGSCGSRPWVHTSWPTLKRRASSLTVKEKLWEPCLLYKAIPWEAADLTLLLHPRHWEGVTLGVISLLPPLAC